jgi:hypothetical protein
LYKKKIYDYSQSTAKKNSSQLELCKHRSVTSQHLLIVQSTENTSSHAGGIDQTMPHPQKHHATPFHPAKWTFCINPGLSAVSASRDEITVSNNSTWFVTREAHEGEFEQQEQ